MEMETLQRDRYVCVCDLTFDELEEKPSTAQHQQTHTDMKLTLQTCLSLVFKDKSEISIDWMQSILQQYFNHKQEKKPLRLVWFVGLLSWVCRKHSMTHIQFIRMSVCRGRERGNDRDVKMLQITGPL